MPDAKHKPFSCPECSKEFGRQDVLVRHRKLHGRNGSIAAENSSSIRSPSIDQAGSEITMTDFSPAASAEGQLLPDQSYIGSQQQFQPSNGIQFPTWSDTDDMLAFLTSDLGGNWPLTLPVAQFQPNFESPGTILPPLENESQSGQGHQAMQQMSKLISVLSSNLTSEIMNTGITSSFLDTCLHVFFDKFIPSFPVLHKATFVVKESSHPLLLNIMALGSLFVGAKDAVPKGEALWRLAHIAVATNWKHLMATRGSRDSCEGVQLVLTAVLGQTYALMSKNESLRMTSQTFHGLGFYWARQCGMFNVPRSAFPVPSLLATEEDKIEAWKVWAAQEVQNRGVLGHYVLDGHISKFSGYAACARHVTNPLLMPASDAAFDATTADEWIKEMQNSADDSMSFRELFNKMFSGASRTDLHLSNFTLRVLLEGLQSLSADLQEACGAVAVGTPRKSEISTALIRVYKEHLETQIPSVDQLELLIRWHAIFLDLASPTTALCRKMCAAFDIPQHLHGTSKQDAGDLDLGVWSQSVNGMRAVLHALAIQNIVEKLPFSRAHAIHIPAAIFAVSTIYSARSIAGFASITTPKSFKWESVWGSELDAQTNDSDAATVDMNRFLSCRYSRTTPNSITKSLMYELNSLQINLNSISSRWGVSHEMDMVLNRWISIANERHPISI
ncbi:C2H2 type zinc finger domain protein [Cadophora sp. MPI-SDFR-AT-0126]|nr:C2H2 type zinc finger domain protein [Leotiomycetes sp. MPI-SDFR-AT-0126]